MLNFLTINRETMNLLKPSSVWIITYSMESLPDDMWTAHCSTCCTSCDYCSRTSNEEMLPEENSNTYSTSTTDCLVCVCVCVCVLWLGCTVTLNYNMSHSPVNCDSEQTNAPFPLVKKTRANLLRSLLTASVDPAADAGFSHVDAARLAFNGNVRRGWTI